MSKVNIFDDRAVLDMIYAIRDASGRIAKEEALSIFADTEQGKRLISWMYNPFITFGITWRNPPQFDVADTATDWNQLGIVHNLLANLANRSLTGNDAKEALTDAMKSLNPSARTILYLCVNKDLKAGIGESSIAAVDPKLIPTFAVMRAHLYEERLVTKFPVVGEPKLDGNRVTFVARDGSGGYFTRTGKVIASLDHMVPVMLNVLRSWYETSNGFGTTLTSINGVPNIVLDGEMMSDKGFDEVNGALNRKTDVHGLIFNVFDCLSWEEFDAVGAVKVSYIDRRKRVSSIVVHASGMGYTAQIKQTPVEVLNSHEHIQEAYARWRSAGYEGLMIKDPNSFYEKKKSRGWLKLKAEDTEDLPIIGVYQGQAGGKYENTIGGLIVDRNGVEVRVSGLTDEVRAEVWRLWVETADACGFLSEVGYQGVSLKSYIELATVPTILLGRFIEVEFHEALASGSLRHPRFVKFRPDKDGEVDK